MKQFSFKNRLAFNYLVSTAMIVCVLFVVIYSIVKYSVYADINADLKHEIEMHFSEMDLNNDIYKWVNIHEWEEREHNQISFDPVFVEIYNPAGKMVEKSPNLKKDNLKLQKSRYETYYFDTTLNTQAIRQVQVPIFRKNELKGFLLIAMSLEEERIVLNNLRHVLVLSYLILLFSLFFITRFIAGRSIRPITEITKTASSISRENLSSRIELPHNKDELFVLSKTINNLLDRIENAVIREKQFTSDASHELRTPLAVIKGTLEVLIRKPREKAEYEEKINFCIEEVNRLNNLVDQLLLLARFENQNQNIKNEKVYLKALILDCLARHSQLINEKDLEIRYDFEGECVISSDYYLIDIIISNLLSNAIKYSNSYGKIKISLHESKESLSCTIADTGIGIPQEDIEKVFNPFYRSGIVDYSKAKGIGIGLSIVKRLCDLLRIDMGIASETDKGTTFTVTIPK